MLKIVDLFSGIGGFSLGLKMAGGFETIAFCEQDKFCQQVLRKHWPDVPIHDDIRAFPTDGFGEIDLVCGGFPCQPWSDAGKKLGTEDDRDLWPEMARLVEELRPRWLVGENVRGFINQPMGLERSLSDLEGIGYSAIPFIVPACAVDAPHRRDRIWIIAKDVGNASSGGQRGDNGRWAGQEPENRCEDVADTDSPRCEEQRRSQPAQPKHQAPQCGSGWLTEPSVGRVAHGIPQRVDRLKALGNAVVPQVVCQIGKAIQASNALGVVNGRD